MHSLISMLILSCDYESNFVNLRDILSNGTIFEIFLLKNSKD